MVASRSLLRVLLFRAGRYFSSVASHRRQMRVRVPSARRAWPMRVSLWHDGQTSKTFEMWMPPSRSTIPPLTFFEGFGRVCRLMMPACSTVTVFLNGSTESTRPVLPLSRPAITRTWSPLRMLTTCRIFSSRLMISRSPRLPDFRGQGNNFGEFLFAQLAAHRPKHARPHRLSRVVHQNGGIVAKPAVGFNLAPRVPAPAPDHCTPPL